MKNRMYVHCPIIFLALLFCNAVALGATPKKVFIIHSYEKGHVCGQPQADGVVDAFSESDLQTRAKELGINIPFEILGAADFVYKEILLK